MSSRTFIQASAITARRAAGRHLTPPAIARPLSTTSSRNLKESDKEDPNYASHQEDSLRKQKEGKGHWKPELASNSEEAVKADRQATSTGGVAEDVKKLQERTKDAAQEKERHGTSMSDGL